MSKEDLVDVFQSNLKIIDALIEDLKENPTTCSAECDTLDLFWIKICLAVENVSKEATCLCMAFSGPPVATIQECQPILHKLEGIAVALVSVFYSLPNKYGLTLKKQVHSAVTDIIRSVHCLGQTILSHNFDVSKEQLQKTGSVWECCDEFPKQPRDNTGAVIKAITQCQSLVSDALQEIEEAEKESGISNETDECWNDPDLTGDAPTWSDHEKQILGPSLGLVKAAKACVKKCIGILSKGQSTDLVVCNIEAQDELNDRIQGVSPTVDELVSCLYPPLDESVIVQNAKDLSTHLVDILEFLRSSPLTTSTDGTWINFLIKAIQHNKEKLYEIVAGD